MLAAASVLAFSADARADLRSFTNAYEFTTVPEGHTALEFWHTESRATWDRNTAQSLESILEIEHGLTDRWDMSFYNVFEQGVNPDAPFRLSEVKLETRYRLADRADWPVDVLVYGELNKHFGESVYGFEGKVILQRDFDRLIVVANAIGEIHVGHDVAKGGEPEYGGALGTTYQLHNKLRVGAEGWLTHADGVNEGWAGPAISIAPSGNWWFAFTAGFAITDASDAFLGRFILGVEL